MGQRRQRNQQRPLIETDNELTDANIEQDERGTSLVRGLVLRVAVSRSGSDRAWRYSFLPPRSMENKTARSAKAFKKWAVKLKALRNCRGAVLQLAGDSIWSGVRP
jgi:hypothetical protein